MKPYISLNLLVCAFVEKRDHISDALRSSVLFAQFKNVKNTHGGVLLFHGGVLR